MGHYTRMFAVYDNGEEIFQGTAYEIREAIETIATKDQLYTYEKTGHRLYGRYTFKDIGKKYVEKKDPPKKKKTPKHDMELEYLVTNLRLYGNTCFKNRGERYKKELEDLGIRFRTKRLITFKDGYLLERV